MSWTIKRTDTFLKSLSRVKPYKEGIIGLGKKLKRLHKDPFPVGGWLAGSLHGKKATLIARQFRLIFPPVEKEQVVYLIAIDHREHG
jgi:mRNA-degrading endonuclease RelE of RelBE toxin-antitoxin system